MRTRVLPFFIFVMLISLFSSAQTAPAISPERKQALDRLGALSGITISEWRYHEGDLYEGSSPNLDDSKWQTIKVGEVFEAGTGWFRTWLEVPRQIQGYNVAGSSIQLDFRTYTQQGVRVFVNGLPIMGGEDSDPAPITMKAEPGQKLLVAVLRLPDQYRRRLDPTILEFHAPASRPDPSVLRDEFLSAQAMLNGHPERQPDGEKTLDAAARAINWSALEKGDQQAFDRSIVQAREIMAPMREWMRNYTVHAVGNSHIDMAWLWPWTETVDVTKRTFSSALRLMREFPDFTFTMASAQAYSWMEDKYPSMFKEIQQRVKEGRWEVVGGMWVEPDLNLPDGESLTRQVLYGKRYFQQKFGVDVRTGWNPDSFGYNWQLPQIYKKAGIDYFVTQKISWNDTTKFPHKLFWWEAPDGSRILTYFPHDYVNPIKPEPIAKDVAEYTQKTGYPEMLYLYGVGDHGGGPTRDMLENALRFRQPDSVYPKLELGTAQSFFDRLSPKASSLNLPVWRDELYLEFHRGVQTTQSETKKNNRRSETLMLEAEKFASVASLFGKPYPQQQFEQAWKKVLFNQFHDILPGSGIAVVYKDAAADQAEVQRSATEILNNSLAELTARVDTRGTGVPVVVYNPLSWSRTDVVEAEVQFAAPTKQTEVLGTGGRPVLAEVVKSSPVTNRVTVRFRADDVPSLGYKVFHIVPVARPRTTPSPVRAAGGAIQNEYYRVIVDPKTGCLTSVYDKANKREALDAGACGNLLQAFVDKPKQWDAWNIDADFETQKWDLNQADEVQLVETTPLRAVIRVKKHFQNSTFVQDVIVQAGVPRVDIHTTADWYEKHILIKAAFPVAARNKNAAYEIPYGSIERPTTRNTPEEKARFEVPALRWADLSDGTFGVSILNDSKYGYDTKDNVIRLSLLRSPADPDPHADEGRHEFTYSIYTHAGDSKNVGTVQRGYELNARLIPVVSQAHSGTLPASHSFVKIEPANVVLSAVKKSEDDNSLILRFYEFSGRSCDVRISVATPLARAAETNLMEKEQKELAVANGVVVVTTKPYEIKSVLLQFGADNRAAVGN